MTARKTAREAARSRTPLDGADAQALEGALTMTEQERDAAITERDRLRRELEALRDRVMSNATLHAYPRCAATIQDIGRDLDAILRGGES